MRRIGLSVVATVIACQILAALPAHAASVTADHAWSRATPPGASTGVAYLTLLSPEGDTLVGVSSPAAARASVHEMTMDGSVMRMRDLPGGLALPPGQAETLRPDGLHIMLSGLKAPLKRGGTVLLHLVFAKSPALDIEASIVGLGATAPN